MVKSDDKYIVSKATIQQLQIASNISSIQGVNSFGANISITTIHFAKEALGREYEMQPYDKIDKIKTAEE